MGSVGFGELLVIGIVALIVFGPHRLPELARRLGDLLAKARTATKDFVDAVDSEYRDDVAPLRGLKEEYDATKQQMTETMSRLTDVPPAGEPSPPKTDERDTDPSDEDEDARDH